MGKSRRVQPCRRLSPTSIKPQPMTQNTALAYSGLADAITQCLFLGLIPTNIEPDRMTLPQPHAVLGTNEFAYDWYFAAGEAEFKRAIELDPNPATAHPGYAENIRALGGREQDALAEVTLAHELDPLSPIITQVIGSVRVSARQYVEAISVCQELEVENPTLPYAHDCLA